PDVRRLGERPELAEQIEDIRFVPGPLSPQNVGIECDDLHATSFHSSTSASAARPQVKSRARAIPAGPSSSRREIASSMPAAMSATSSASTTTAAPPATSSIDVPREVTTGVPHAIASSTGSPKPSYSEG